MKNLLKLSHSSLAWIILFTLVFQACNAKKKRIEHNQKNETTSGHFQLYSEPLLHRQDLDTNEKRLVVVATSDLGGKLDVQFETVQGTKKSEKAVLEVGGLNSWKEYFEIIKTTYPGETIFLDAGNFIAKSVEAERMFKFFKDFNYQAIGIARNEILADKKDNLEGFKKMFISASVPVINSNVLELKTLLPVSFGMMKPFHLFTINGMKIGVINVVDPEVALEASSLVMNGHNITPVNQGLIKYSYELRKLGAQIVIAFINSAVDCTTKLAKNKNLPPEKVNFDPYQSKICDEEKSLFIALKSLPEGTVDLIIASGNKQKVANFIMGSAVVQDIGGGKYFNLVELIYDTNSKKILKDKSEIHQPIKLCRQFIKKTMDCFDSEAAEDLTIVPASFWGKVIGGEIQSQ